MKLLVFSDIHGDTRALDRLMEIEADYYIAAGDLANFGRGLDRVGPILQRRAAQMHVIPGNHESEADISGFCERYGFNDLHGSSIRVGRYELAALGYSNPTPFNTPGEYTEEQLAQKLQAFAGLEPLVLICHCPPKNTQLDRAADGQHFGSTAVRDFIERNQPVYFCCGHVHEAAGVEETIGRTHGWNVGKRGVILDLSK